MCCMLSTFHVSPRIVANIIQENAFENVVYEMAAILSYPLFPYVILKYSSMQAQ